MATHTREIVVIKTLANDSIAQLIADAFIYSRAKHVAVKFTVNKTDIMIEHDPDKPTMEQVIEAYSVYLGAEGYSGENSLNLNTIRDAEVSGITRIHARIPPRERAYDGMGLAQAAVDQLPQLQRMELFKRYCPRCGRKDPRCMCR